MEHGKICTKCNEYKNINDFRKHKRRKDGHSSSCRSCDTERDKLYYAKNKSNILEKQKEFRENNKDIVAERKKREYENNKERYAERNKLWHNENKERVNENSRNWSKRNKKKRAEHRKKWRMNNKDKIYSYGLKRRSYKQKVSFVTHERIEILERYNYTCQCCGIRVHDRSTGHWNTPDKAHIDHIIPVSKGGNSELDNLQLLCRTCNLSKSDKIIHIAS